MRELSKVDDMGSANNGQFREVRRRAPVISVFRLEIEGKQKEISERCHYAVIASCVSMNHPVLLMTTSQCRE